MIDQTTTTRDSAASRDDRLSDDVAPAPALDECILGHRVSVGQRVDARSAPAGRVSRLLRDRRTGRVAGIVVRTRRLFGRELVVPIDLVAGHSAGRLVLTTDRAGLAELPTYRADDEIESEVERALARDEDLRRWRGLTLRVSVLDGALALWGYLPDRRSQSRAVAVASRVPGVASLSNLTFADDSLGLAVARALAEDTGTRPFFFQVHVREGVAHLGGTLEGTAPSAETKRAAQEIAANVSGVRSAFIDFGEMGADEGLPVLPRIGAPVIAEDGPLGHLELVVMDPASRRVTDLVVAGPANSENGDGMTADSAPRVRRILVPARSVAHVTAQAVLLRLDRAAASRLRHYRDDEHRAPSTTWRRVPDYRREEVRFAVRNGRLQPADSDARSRPWLGSPRG